MKETTVLIVGAGPAGASCARRLKQSGIDFIILDKAAFPRDKPCAGWVSPGVFKILGQLPTSYPHTIHLFRRIIFHFPTFSLPVKTAQFSIRRSEFDYWILESAGIRPVHEKVDMIHQDGEYYIVNKKYKTRILVGAGGTHCPVRKMLLPEDRKENPNELIIGVAAEVEMRYPVRDCHLWFFERGISGYSWFLPKSKDKVNIGIGARQVLLDAKGEKIMEHWDYFLQKLQRMGWVDQKNIHPQGHFYYLQKCNEIPSRKNVYLIGDAARLSTLDLGEGIYNAIRSGAMLADYIAGKRSSLSNIVRKYSFPGILFPFY